MQPPYPKEFDEALKSVCHGKTAEYEYARILENADLTADFIQQRLTSKLDWYEKHKAECRLSPGESWQDMGLRVMYQGNLGIEVPRDGEVICSRGKLLIVDWRSWCPILMYCAHRGQATVPVCSVLYHVQFQYLLSLILPGALFTRDYTRIRPDASCCREIIFYAGGVSDEISAASGARATRRCD